MASNGYQSVLKMDELIDEVQSIDRTRPRRNPTMLKLQWIAERVRRCERIKKQIHDGSYGVSSRAVARALLNLPKE